MKTIFFDYYHPYAGLCNQLYLITNHINLCYKNGTQIYIHRFNTDIFKKNRVSLNTVLDIPKTNENLKRLTGREIINAEPPDIIESIPRLQIYPVSNIAILNCLEFNETILEKVNNFKEKSKSYYAIHFRLDIDCILHYTFGKTVYNRFMDLANRESRLAKEYFDSLNQTVIKEYCEFLMSQYLTFVKQLGFDKTWYICTPILKNEIHDPFKVYLSQLTDFINKSNGSYSISQTFYRERELNAIVDIVILRDAEKMIGFQGSSFSEGYCYKVNQIRKVTKEFVFVKERNEVY
jgi:hypothetical protein